MDAKFDLSIYNRLYLAGENHEVIWYRNMEQE